LSSSEETARGLSSLADACVEAVTLWAIDDIAAKDGATDDESAPFAVLALGKLGRCELTFLSDLDLVFVSDTSGEWAARRRTESETILARIAERAIFYLTEPVAGGAAFHVDARLRPEGVNSPLVTSLEGFRRHFERAQEVWEIQTYLGARVIAGDRRLGEQALAIAMGAIAGVGDRAMVAGAVRSMRARLEATVVLPEWALSDFKRGRGGLVDLEFAAQFLQIVHAGERADWASLAPRDVLSAASEAGWLERADAESLSEDYDFLRRLEADVRLILESQQTCFPADPVRLDALLHAPGREAGSGEALRDEFVRRTQRVRESFDWIFGGQ
jgi:glutamate-ammonia-ligase adenylyltransferase